jgi:K+-transporting ATPase ATPase A chain
MGAAAVRRGGHGAGRAAPGDRVFLPVERRVYRTLGVDPERSWTWRSYALAVLAFGLVSTLLLYAILRLQGVLPGNPAHAPGMSPLLSFNTAISFVTGTNWQAYEGETQASYLADTVGLVVAQFTAAGVGLAVALAVIRGVAGRTRTIGNCWCDLTRSLVRVFGPLSVIAALVMVSQGAVQTLHGFRVASTVAGGTQKIPGGLVASMEAIKLLGTNGGSWYGTGGAHPFENPDGFTNRSPSSSCSAGSSAGRGKRTRPSRSWPSSSWPTPWCRCRPNCTATTCCRPRSRRWRGRSARAATWKERRRPSAPRARP